MSPSTAGRSRWNTDNYINLTGNSTFWRSENQNFEAMPCVWMPVLKKASEVWSNGGNKERICDCNNWRLTFDLELLDPEMPIGIAAALLLMSCLQYQAGRKLLALVGQHRVLTARQLMLLDVLVHQPGKDKNIDDNHCAKELKSKSMVLVGVASIVMNSS